MCTRIRKGIINPNYPGFQSLAYTLNDDNFDYSSENPSDDDEDSYVSESDDNEIKQREKEHGEPEEGDENGNSYDGNGGANENELHPHSGMNVPPVHLSTALYNASMTTALESEECYPISPFRRSRMRLIPTGCKSPGTNPTALYGTEDKLESTVIYACTPPDIVLQHSFDRRAVVLGSSNELLKASVELSNGQRPDLIPEQQLAELRQLEQLKSLDQDPLKHINHYPELGRTTKATPVLAEADAADDKERSDEENDDERDVEGNRTPPSPAIEPLDAIGTISISTSDSSCNFLRDGTLSPDQMLDDTTRCYGSVTDGTLSDDSEQESDEGEFEYKPYAEDGSLEDTYRSPVHDAAEGTADSGDSAGSSPGEVQYHLVDDCSNQTVQITRSRQSTEQSPTNHYHLLQHYSSPVPVDYHNNLTQCGNATLEQEVNRNVRYHSPEQHAQIDPSEFGYVNAIRTGGRIANQAELVSTEYPDARPTTLNFSRREVKEHRVMPEKKIVEDNQTDMPVPTKQHQKVAKVNPFCELLLQENDTCDFFTKQAKLQIEARMALCQAKDMAHMQMEIEKRSLPLSPVTRVIHSAVEKAGLSLAEDKRRLSRYYLTRLNVHQLQTILTELQGHAEVLNEELVELLMERDELHISQDATLIDIEDLSRYLCAKEQTIVHAERQRKSYHWASNRAGQKPQTSLPQPPIRSTCGMAIPAYRYH
uniref:SCHIP-1 domain-containing protein n=1 Tax=Anopheles dirus TaxID=7168 RepID=A0A182NFN8_9DIPT